MENRCCFVLFQIDHNTSCGKYMNLFHFANIVRMKDSNVKSSLLVNCSVKLVWKKKMVSFSCFYPFECLLFKKTPLLLKDFQLFHLGLCLISHTLEKREIWKFYEETLKSYPRIFFIFHYKYFKFESTKTCKPVMSKE